MSTSTLNTRRKYRYSLHQGQEKVAHRRLDFLYHSGMELNDWILTARKKAKLTQVELGEELNVTKGNVSGWEKGKHSPSWKTILKISELAKIPLPIKKIHYEGLIETEAAKHALRQEKEPYTVGAVDWPLDLPKEKFDLMDDTDREEINSYIEHRFSQWEKRQKKKERKRKTG